MALALWFRMYVGHLGLNSGLGLSSLKAQGSGPGDRSFFSGPGVRA